MLSAAGLATEATKEIGRYVWRKAILNSCTMSIAAITGMNMQEMIEFPPTAQLVELLLQESVAVAAAYGFDYGPGFVESVRDFNQHAGPHKPSMRGGHRERAQNGKPVSHSPHRGVCRAERSPGAAAQNRSESH